jgi:benzoyl-CoA reductase subunit D
MVTAGVDIGAKNTRVVLLDDGAVVARAGRRTGFDPPRAAQEAMHDALGQVGSDAGGVAAIVATGSGGEDVAADGRVTAVTAAARAIHTLDARVRTVVEVGAEESRGVRVDERGGVASFVVNERCAAGSGAFIEAMARVLEMSPEEFAGISLESGRSLPMNAQCVVFAESEVVGLVHANTPARDIARAVHDAVAGRIISMVRRIGIEGELALVGGMARNVGFHRSLERAAQREVIVPEHPEFAGALGAALAASEKGG